MHQTILRAWSAGSWLLNPGRLIDWLLDQLDDVSLAMVPVRVDVRSRREIGVGTRFD
jgi:hypothetical protein